MHCGRHDDAHAALLEARKHARQARDQQTWISTEGHIGACLLARGQPRHARKYLERAIQLARDHRDRDAEAKWLIEAAQSALAEQDLDAADRLARSALLIAKPADRVPAILAGEWIRYRVAKLRCPDGADADRRRIAYMRRLLRRVAPHERLDLLEHIGRDLAAPTG